MALNKVNLPYFRDSQRHQAPPQSHDIELQDHVREAGAFQAVFTGMTSKGWDTNTVDFLAYCFKFKYIICL